MFLAFSLFAPHSAVFYLCFLFRAGGRIDLYVLTSSNGLDLFFHNQSHALSPFKCCTSDATVNDQFKAPVRHVLKATVTAAQSVLML